MDAPKRANAPETAPVNTKMGAGSWAVLVVLIALLLATMVIVYLGWNSAKDADVPASAYVAMTFGVIISLAVGFGLMALVFYSSRQGYDEAPILLEVRGLESADGAPTASAETNANTAAGLKP